VTHLCLLISSSFTALKVVSPQTPIPDTSLNPNIQLHSLFYSGSHVGDNPTDIEKNQAQQRIVIRSLEPESQRRSSGRGHLQASGHHGLPSNFFFVQFCFVFLWIHCSTIRRALFCCRWGSIVLGAQVRLGGSDGGDGRENREIPPVFVKESACFWNLFVVFYILLRSVN
jgi:hypothetical protein